MTHPDHLTPTNPLPVTSANRYGHTTYIQYILYELIGGDTVHPHDAILPLKCSEPHNMCMFNFSHENKNVLKATDIAELHIMYCLVNNAKLLHLWCCLVTSIYCCHLRNKKKRNNVYFYLACDKLNT